MPRTKDENLAEIQRSGVVAIIRAKSAEHIADIARALLAGGVNTIEVTMSTPNAIRCIEQLANAHGDRAVIGVGTVLDAATARDAIAAGAQFVVSPVVDAAVIEA